MWGQPLQSDIQSAEEHENEEEEEEEEEEKEDEAEQVRALRVLGRGAEDGAAVGGPAAALAPRPAAPAHGGGRGRGRAAGHRPGPDSCISYYDHQLLPSMPWKVFLQEPS